MYPVQVNKEHTGNGVLLYGLQGTNFYKEIEKSEAMTREDEMEYAAFLLNNLWKPADDNELPEINREVIVLLSNNKVCYAHRPQEFWDGKNIATGEITRHYPKRYDKGNWNIPDVKWWLDLDLPKTDK